MRLCHRECLLGSYGKVRCYANEGTDSEKKRSAAGKYKTMCEESSPRRLVSAELLVCLCI
jgi:hypothetical protein